MSRCPSPPGSKLGLSQPLGRQNEGFLEVSHSDQVSGGGRHWYTRDQTVLGVGEWVAGHLGGRAFPASVTPASHWQPAVGASSSGLHDLSLEGLGPRRGRFVGRLKMDPGGLPSCCSEITPCRGDRNLASGVRVEGGDVCGLLRERGLLCSGLHVPGST